MNAIVALPLGRRPRKLKPLPGTDAVFAVCTKLEQPLMGNGYVVRLLDRTHAQILAWINGCAKVYATGDILRQRPDTPPTILLDYAGAAEGSIRVHGSRVGRYRLAGANYAEAVECDLALGAYGRGVQPIVPFLAALWVAASHTTAD